MTPACVAFMAGLCVQPPYDRAVNINAMVAVTAPDGRPFGVADTDAVHRLGVKIEAYQTDNIVARDPAGLPRACVGDACVVYLKTCSGDALRCEWDWGPAPAVGGDDSTVIVTIWITAISRQAMNRAVRAISVQPRTGKDTVVNLPLTAMAQLSAEAYSRPCEGAIQTDCVNPFVGRVPNMRRDRSPPPGARRG